MRSENHGHEGDDLVLIWRGRGFEEAMGLGSWFEERGALKRPWVLIWERERERERGALNLVCVWIGWDSMGLFNIIFVLFIFSIWGYPELEEHEFMFCSEFFVFFPKKRKKNDNFSGFKIFRFKIHLDLN